MVQTKADLLPSRNMGQALSSHGPIDYAKIDFNALSADLAKEIARGFNTGILSNFFRKRSINIKTEQLNLMSQYLSSYERMNQQALQMQFQLTIQPVLLKNMVLGYYEESRRLAELSLNEHNLKIIQFKSQMHSLDIERREKEEALRRQEEMNRLAADKEREEIEAAKIKNASSRTIVKILEKIESDLDVGNITYNQAWLLRTAMQSDNTPEFNANKYEEELARMKEETEKLRKENDILEQKKRREKDQSDISGAEAERTINEIKGAR